MELVSLVCSFLAVIGLALLYYAVRYFTLRKPVAGSLLLVPGFFCVIPFAMGTGAGLILLGLFAVIGLILMGRAIRYFASREALPGVLMLVSGLLCLAPGALLLVAFWWFLTTWK